MQMKFYTADRIFTGTQWLEGAVIQTANGQVVSIQSQDQVNKSEVQSYHDAFIAPAFIDVQLYGAHGRLLSVYPESNTLSLIAEYCRSGGTTLCLPTVATNTNEVFLQCIDAVRNYWSNGGKGVWGLHLEGPWINPIKRGAHIESLIHAPDITEVKKLLEYGKGVVKMITLAPEVCSPEVLALIQSYGITISAGHSNASFEQATDAFDNGIGTITHLYNAMSSLQHRAPGMVGAAFLHPSVRASIIADGHHVDFEAIRIAKQLMGERLFVITDAVTNTDKGPYQHQMAGDKYESGGTLSGSAITQKHSLQNLVNKVGVELGEALRMCSLYPAQVIDADSLYGKIAPGYAAQFAIISNDLDLLDVVTL